MPSRALLSRSDAAASIPDVCDLKVKFQALSDLQPPPTAPPLPPPYRLAELQTDDTYDSIEHRTTSTTTTWAVIGLTVSALMCLLLLASTLSCCLLTSMCPYYTGVWVSSLCLINCGLGAAALSTGSPRNWCVAHLAISVLSFASCVLLLVLSVVNWTDIGTRMPLVSDDFYRQHYRAQQQQRARHYSLSTVATVDNIDPPPDDLYCLLSTYNADRISYIYQTQETFDFEACWTTYKLAITLNTLNLFFALYLETIMRQFYEPLVIMLSSIINTSTAFFQWLAWLCVQNIWDLVQDVISDATDKHQRQKEISIHVQLID
ncbi:hypothetical protein T05_16292 [Trichinella murrelli]|uniref:Transmembrane protein n=1 Tax=Trichinella murrelli TaxID=144512 RepID=A0A0V0TNS2_9BILA|nr:hypothetical protein T05_16292 [Trichinella murrelli]